MDSAWSFLAPLDHFIEHWIKHKLIEKNKVIKIAAAHKMLEKLEEKGLRNKRSVYHNLINQIRAKSIRQIR